MKIFLTGVITTPYAKEYLNKCADTLRRHHFECSTPSEAAWIPPEVRPQHDSLHTEYAALEQAHLLLAILDGYNVNDGVAGHIGTFYALMQRDPAKRCILGILHDTRVAGWTWSAGASTLNYYILGCISEGGQIFRSFNEALDHLLSLQREMGNSGAVDESTL
jgi:hypothetical protein